MILKIFVLVLCLGLSLQLDNGLGLTPQMGWNSWNHFGCKISESLIKRTADLLVSTGLAAKGYKYLNLDDCWQLARDPLTKQIVEDKNNFPSGMKVLSNYIHSKGLKFGLYSDAGQKTCQGRPGSLGFQKIDALTYASWEVDYLKYDNCFNKNISGKIRYFNMMKALNESGRPIFYSMCNWGQQNSWEWAAPIANSWRTTGDINKHWSSFVKILDMQVGLEYYSGKGAWNDPDMLQVGNGGMTFNQSLAHFSLWCILKAPLLIGCSLESMSSSAQTILGNQQLIAINQDQLGKQGYRIKKEVNSTTSQIKEVWGGELSQNRFVVAFFNRDESQAQISVSIKTDIKKNVDSYTVRDVIQHKDLGVMTNDVIKLTLSRHSIKVYVLKFLQSDQSHPVVLEQ